MLVDVDIAKTADVAKGDDVEAGRILVGTWGGVCCNTTVTDVGLRELLTPPLSKAGGNSEELDARAVIVVGHG